MKTLQIEVAIIGSGTAGMAAYKAARALCESVLLIESGPVGTTCARVGCMPSKLLIAAAGAAHHARHAEPFGVRVQDVRVDGKAVMERVRHERDRFVGFVLAAVESLAPSDRLTARVHFRDANTLVTQQGQVIQARRVVIATGSRPVLPSMFDGLGACLLTNENIFDLPTLPGRLAVFGTGPLGMELAQAMSRLGVVVKMFGVGGGIAGLRDPEMRDYAERTFNEEFYLDAAADVRSVRKSGTGVEIQYLHKDGAWHTEQFDCVLVATGRAPALADLELGSTGLALDKRGVPVFERSTMRCGDSSIFMAGDASNDAPLLHEDADQGRIAGENAARFPDVRSCIRYTPLALVFTEPQLAFVGVNPEQLALHYKDRFATGRVSFEDQGRSRVMLCNKGLLKVYAEHGTGLVLGAEMFGPAAEHLGHLLAWAVQQGMTVSGMLDMPFYHPVIEEGLRTALRDLDLQMHAGAGVAKDAMACGPGG